MSDQTKWRSVRHRIQGGDNLSWRPLRLLCIYRLIAVAVVLSGFAASQAFASDDGIPMPVVFFYTATGYFASGFVCLALAYQRRPRFIIHVVVGTLVDIAALTVLIHSSGGMDVGFGILMLVAVGAGSLLAGARLGSFFASVATIALFFEQFLAFTAGETGTAGFTAVAFVGLGIFATALAGAYLARRARESEALAEQRGIDVENLEALNAHIVQRLDTGVVALDPDGDIRLANSTAREMLGPLKPGIGQHLDRRAPALARSYRLWCAGDREADEPLSDAIGSSEFVPHFQPLGPGGASGTLIFLEDLTRMRAQVQEAKLASLGRLTASIAHEIRNPLGAMLQATQLLEEADYLQDGERRLAAIISKQGRRMNETVENILQLSRRAPPDRQIIQLADWLPEFVGEWEDTHGNQGLAISVDAGPAPAHCDPTHLRQVVDNLLRNALQYGGARDDKRAFVRSYIDDNERARLEVEDNGSGIDPAVSQQLFEPFATSSRSGTGLGLYLSRELCEANEARITLAKGSEGEGACFRIVFARPPSEGSET
jgi:two-component system sensor histidine kinase PilS (NtrC family)